VENGSREENASKDKVEMFIGHNAARRQSVAQAGLEMARTRQVAACFFAGLAAGLAEGFLGAGFRALLATGFRVTGRMLVGSPAAALGSGSGLNCARHPGESWDLLRAMQAVTRSTSGISALQSRNASPVQACSCSGV
jgi:hypothetical protein